MIYQQKCPKCGEWMKKIPIKKNGSEEIIEYYCDNCGKSMTFYPKTGEIKFEHTKFF